MPDGREVGTYSTGAAAGMAQGAMFGPWGMLIGGLAGGISSVAGRRRRAKAKRRTAGAFRARGEALQAAYSGARGEYKPLAERQERQLSELERLITDPRAATQKREAAMERARSRRLPGLRAGQTARGMFTAGPGLAQEAEFEAAFETAFGELREKERERLRTQLLGEIRGPAETYRKLGGEYELAQAGLIGETEALRAAEYAQPGGMEQLYAGMTQAAGPAMEQAIMNMMLKYGAGSWGGGGGARRPEARYPGATSPSTGYGA